MQSVGRLGRVESVWRRIAVALLAGLLLSLVPSDHAALAQSQRQAIKGEVSVSTTGGFGRLVIRLAGELDGISSSGDRTA